MIGVHTNRLEARIVTLEASLTSVLSRLTQLEADSIANGESRMAAVETGVTNLDTIVSGLDARITALENP